MRLLLDFGASPNTIVGNKSLLSIAAHKGYPEAIKLLLDSKASLTRGSYHPLIEVLASGNREAFAILVHGREPELPFLVIDGKPYLIHAIQTKTMLLPVIAAIISKETEVARANGRNDFPEISLTNPEKKRLKAALEVKDSLISIDSVNEKVKRLKSPWSARGIDELETLEASYAGGDTVVGDALLNDRDNESVFEPNRSRVSEFPIDPNLDAISLRNNPVFEAGSDEEEDR